MKRLNVKPQDLTLWVPNEKVECQAARLDPMGSLLPRKAKLESVLSSLERDGYLIINSNEGVYQFRDELLRIFTSLLLIDQRESRVRRREMDELKSTDAQANEESPPRQFLRDLLDGVIDDDRINHALETLKDAEYNVDWDDEDNSDLTRFHV
jgi:hypothetical protein